MIRSSLLATLVLAGFAGPAFADRNATTDGLFVNIRSGAGVNHPVICLAWPNVTFTVTGCAGNWCGVKYLKTTGYMSARHIVMQD
jgi:uncharacterized protein YraI